jgi:hypothetical protein
VTGAGRPATHALSPQARAYAIERMAERELDVLVIGGQRHVEPLEHQKANRAGQFREGKMPCRAMQKLSAR